VKKVALITGGTSKLGGYVIKLLKKHNFEVVIQYQSQSDVAELLVKNQLIDHAIKADFTKQKEINSLLSLVNKLYPQVDVLINNAAIFELDTAADFTLQTLQNHLKINAIAPITLMQTLANKQQKHLKVLNFLDVMTLKKTRMYFSYNLSKRMLESASHLMNLENISIENLYLDKIDSGEALQKLLDQISKILATV
jgi:NAD(P)-dependent dehydrogenase (short-subunit alcohol dehydrogenase family)